MTAHLVLLIVAAICFLLAAVGVPQQSRVNVMALGLFFWVLGVIFAGTR